MTGGELAEIRKAAGLSQTELAQRVGIGRHAVIYWETKPVIDRHAWAVCRMAEVLPLSPLPSCHIAIPEHPNPLAVALAEQEARFLRQVARIAEQSEAWKAKRRVRCGAKTRKGTPCRCKSEPGKKRCKYHGGMSTGARTPEGRARIAEAQRLRWTRWRAERGLQDGPQDCREEQAKT